MIPRVPSSGVRPQGEVEGAVAGLRRDAHVMRNLTAWHRLPARPADYSAWPEGVARRLVAALARRGIGRPYAHQAQAVSAALGGANVAIATGTASGKTLCYNVPVLTALLDDPQARALYLFPTKALTQDQATALGELVAEVGADLPIHAYDGDTDTRARPQIRNRARVLLSNPDMLHTGILPHHTKWATFFRGLRYVVVDELHTYRGVFGSHMANVLRRLRRVCRFYGADPQFVCCSATIANPVELAEAIIGGPVTSIDHDGSPRGERNLLFYNPPLVDRELGIRRSSLLEGRSLAGRLIDEQVQTIAFTRTRLAAEVLLTYLQSDGRRVGRSPQLVRGYRGGYLPNERRQIERGLRQGSVRGVVATNALELGVDIGELGAVVMVGYPGTIASAWQQIGRAGRRQGASLAVLVAGADPLDQYMVLHPEYFMGRSPEHAYINPDNPLILLGHLACAAFELPFAEGERFGSLDVSPYLELLREEGLLHGSREGNYWVGETYPAANISLRSSSPDGFVISQEGDGRAIGLVDRATAPIRIHEGAIYMHEGQPYEVVQLDWEGGRATVRPTEVDYFTDASSSTHVEVIEEQAQAKDGNACKGWGAVRVRTKATAYRKVRLFTHENLGWGMIDLPEQEMDTQGCWVWLPPDVEEMLVDEGVLRPDVRFDRGPNWPEMRRRARERDGFRCQACGVPEREDREHDVHHIRPFRAFGYRPGENDHYLEANQLNNLVTLCRRCHWQADGSQAPAGALAGLGTAVANVAPLFLMCDPHDIGVVPEVRSSHTGGPTITVYDAVPAGIGLSEQLFRVQRDVWRAAGELVAACSCEAGCPGCIGPILEPGRNVKQQVLRLVAAALGEAVDEAAGARSAEP